MAKKIIVGVSKILEMIAETPPGIMLPALSRKIGVAEATMANNLAPLLESGMVARANIGTTGKPVYVYHLPDRAVCDHESDVTA
jgi:predicted transcriptional regulator